MASSLVVALKLNGMLVSESFLRFSAFLVPASFRGDKALGDEYGDNSFRLFVMLEHVLAGFSEMGDSGTPCCMSVTTEVSTPEGHRCRSTDVGVGVETGVTESNQLLLSSAEA